MAVQLVSSRDSVDAAGTAQKTPRQAQAAPRTDSNAVSDSNPEQLRRAVREMQRTVESMASELSFSIDQESGKTVVRVIDSATQELIRQIPSEEIMLISHALNRLAGLLVQENA